LAEGWAGKGIRIHAAGLYATEAEALETFSLLGFGRIVMDAAAPVASILDAVPPQPYGPSLASRPSVAIRPAEANRDLAALVWMNAALAAHIGAPPVFMPRTRGADGQEWEAWFREPEAVALIAEYGGEACGYIKAQAPQFDVSDAVRYQGVLGINGLYVDPACRGKGIATALLRGLAEYARVAGYGTVSVDCETTNPEAYRFWTRFFEPVGWSLERRI
jgi:GNAT superfamily N-acetyltransferase